jgi:hypothetical protein
MVLGQGELIQLHLQHGKEEKTVVCLRSMIIEELSYRIINFNLPLLFGWYSNLTPFRNIETSAWGGGVGGGGISIHGPFPFPQGSVPVTRWSGETKKVEKGQESPEAPGFFSPA